MFAYEELGEISNSPSGGKETRTTKRRGLASFNQEMRGKHMNHIASQSGITEVKRLRTANTQIFNNWREGELFSVNKKFNKLFSTNLALKYKSSGRNEI